MEGIDLTNLGLVPVVAAVVSAIRMAGLKTKMAPIASMIVGVIGVYLFNDFVISGENIVIGLVTGLTASGLYSGIKTTLMK